MALAMAMALVLALAMAVAMALAMALALARALAMAMAMERGDKMNFEEALKKLNIEDYKEAIFNSNSHGELFHLMDYILLHQYDN